MNIGTLVTKILIISFNEQSPNLNQHLLTLHSLMKKFPEVVGLLDLIEEHAQSKAIRFHRILRDIFSQDSSKREFATSIIRSNLSKDTQEIDIRDVMGQTIDMRSPMNETSLELESINNNYDSSSLDIMNIQSILMSSTSDFMIKKSCLEQLTLILFDVVSKRGKQLFKSSMSAGSKDLFTFLIHEIIHCYNTCQGYLRS